MTLHDAMIQAWAISKDDRCGQHVNRRLDGSYYTSDWYNADSTVVTYENGRLQFVSADAPEASAIATRMHMEARS
jgi:hypothetical protein